MGVLPKLFENAVKWLPFISHEYPRIFFPLYSHVFPIGYPRVNSHGSGTPMVFSENRLHMVDFPHLLVGGWALPLWKMMEFVVGMTIIPNIWKVMIHSCFKPPISLCKPLLEGNPCVSARLQSSHSNLKRNRRPQRSQCRLAVRPGIVAVL